MNEQGMKYSSTDISERMNLMYAIFQKDLEIHRLQDEQKQMQQQLVDMDMNMYGRVSKKTAQILEAFHCEALSNGRVIEVPIWERDMQKQEPESAAGSQHPESVHKKLNTYKAAEKQQQSDSREKVNQKKEMPELV